MGIYFIRNKEDYLQYEGRYVYCETCLVKVCLNEVYVMAHCLNKTYIFCSSECYGQWVYEK